MSLKAWYENRWLAEHESSPEEVSDLLAVIDRDLNDAKVDRISSDWRLGIAYNGALQLAVLALAAAGYRATGSGHHERAIRSLRFTIEADPEVIDALDVVRRKRNQSNYDRAGTASDAEADEVIRLATALRTHVLDWLEDEHPELLESGPP